MWFDMSRIVECVPNFSEGRNKEVIDAIASAIGSTEGCSLLDVDPGPSTNRTVYTFVGPPEAVIEGALNGARAASQLIDMSRHVGEHPRLGALDVCPFVPVKNVTMEDCVECAKEFGKRLAEELEVPVYLYGEASEQDYRKAVPQIRQGEYENLPQRLQKDEWKPDFGPAEFRPTWGATMSGARKFLIAYNVNLLSTKEQAHRIALNIREQGRGDDKPGKLKKVQGIGWYLGEANMAQVSVNISDFEITPIHVVYEEVKKDAEELNLAICGSQIVGLVPLSALLMSAEYYIEREGLFLLENDQKIRLVIDRLGLQSFDSFKPKERIIEYMIDDDEPRGPFLGMPLESFFHAIGGRTATPGGGSASAVCATLGAALGTMVGFLSYGNRKFEHLDKEMRKILPDLYECTKKLMPIVDHDAVAYEDFMIACKLPKDSPEEQERREMAMESTLKNSALVPLNLAVTANKAWPAFKRVAEIGNENCISDLQVGARALETGVWGAYYNVMTNLKDVKDEEFKEKVKTEIENELKEAQKSKEEILKLAESRLG